MSLAPGTRLGPYEIIGTLGAGGMGEVYRARDLRLERHVAVKLLTSRDDDASARLLREARNASALNHPNVCTLHEIGEADGRPFLVLELVEGEPLDRRIAAGGGLPASTARTLGIQIAEALAHAHARGVVHRDLKSANVVLTPEGRAKVLDFGIARRISAGDLAEATRSIATLTADHEIAGTLPYMAPEVLAGQPADARADLWALGVMLVEMTSGTRPFEGPTALALTTAILRDAPRIPDDMPPRLATVARRLLAKDPADRYGSAEEVAGALATTDASAAPAAPSPRGVTRTMGIPLAAVVVVLGAVALWWALGNSASSDASAPIASIAVLPLANLSGADDQQYFADGMTEALISELSAIGDLRVISRTSVMQFKGTTRPLPEIAAALRVDGIVEGTVLRGDGTVRITARLIDARSDSQVWSGNYQQPLSDAIALQREVAAEVGREIRGELTPTDTARLARRTTVDEQAYQSYLRGRFHWNLRSSSDLFLAVEHFDRAIDRDPDFALAHAGLADAYVVLGDYRDLNPADAYGRARGAVDKALRLDPALAEAHTTRAWLSVALERDWAAAERSFARAVELNPGYATAHQWHGEYLAALGRFDEAFAAMARARDLDPLAPMPQAIHGWTAYLAGRFDDAIRLCEGVLARDPNFRPARMYRAWTYMDQGRLDEAQAEVNALLRVSSSPAVPLATLGRIHARRGDLAAARDVIAKLQALPYQPSFDIAKLYAEMQDRDRTIEWLERAEQERSSAVLYIKWDRAFAWLREDPGFGALLARLNLD
jgi:eukaryotic-like serine/threonine-protein kinase